MRQTERTLYSREIPHSSFRFVDLRSPDGPASKEQLFAEISKNPVPINGLDNPIYHEVEGKEFTVDFVLEQIALKTRLAENDQNYEQKQAAIDQFPIDAQRLVERVQMFEEEFRTAFENTALYNQETPFTAELVFALRDFLVARIPTWFPIWDCNPITQYSHEQQVMNFRERTLKHIDCNMLYIFEYVKEWNGLVEKENIDDTNKNVLQLDPNFMMCRALLHDLGRWFTQDSRAHEEIPAMLTENGLRRELLTLDDGNAATHPRAFDLSQPMSLKSMIRVIEFQTDFYSKPHNDFVWDEATKLLLAEDSVIPFEQRQAIVANLENLRQKELRHPELALMYMLYSGRGYRQTTSDDMDNWHQILQVELANNPAKLRYLEQEAVMLETSRVFLTTLGMSPNMMRSRVMEKWEKLDSADHQFLEKCFPELVAEVRGAQAQPQIQV